MQITTSTLLLQNLIVPEGFVISEITKLGQK